MTEVRSVETGAVGVFATQAFQVGDVIIEEDKPLVVLAPASPEQEESLLASLLTISQKKKKKSKVDKNTIVPPSTVSAKYEGKFRGMVLAAASFSVQEQNESVRESLTALYHPNHASEELSAEEQDIVHVAKEAVRYLQKRSKPGSALEQLVSQQPDFVIELMLIWSCNAFQGGCIYEKTSRINHSCNPNAIVVDSGEKSRQVVKAAAPIAVGEGISISYLGLMLYADARTRQQELLVKKHFECKCHRCKEMPDVAAAIPCPSCHERHGRHLDEDVQYDDDQTVHYAVPPAGKTGNCVYCNHCHETTSLPPNGGSPGHVLNLTLTVSDKVVSCLRDRNASNKEDDMALQAEWDEQLLQLASTVVGARHWTTNLLLLLRLDRMLQAQHSSMLLMESGTPPDLAEVAEGIDALERVCRFVDGLNLKLHMGHLLSHVVIGVARTLVSLGDTKSKKYAAEWLKKIEQYTMHFESDGMKTVVETLQVAWEKGDDPMEEVEQDDGRGDKKRAKTS